MSNTGIYTADLFNLDCGDVLHERLTTFIEGSLLIQDGQVDRLQQVRPF